EHHRVCHCLALHRFYPASRQTNRNPMMLQRLISNPTLRELEKNTVCRESKVAVPNRASEGRQT
ncbi:hypothetical protein ABC974_26295, partial [Sphingomonas oligophenolica]